jgi:hypothetical protein
MPTVDLTDNEWGQLMGILATAPWRDANPLLMKIGDQLRAQHLPPPQPTPVATNKQTNTGSKEIEHG